MMNREELLRKEGKVEAPADFTESTIWKIDKIIKTREFIEFVFLVWSQFFILSFEVIETLFSQRKKKYMIDETLLSRLYKPLK